MSLLCYRAKNKLDKSKRKYKECPQSKFPDREAELFCENCGHSLGRKDVLIIDLETVKYCSKCIEKYIKETPFDIPDGTVVKDFGDSVYLKYKSGGYIEQTVLKDCYFNTKGRYIKVKGKRVYI
jgi:hypothetical protein